MDGTNSNILRIEEKVLQLLKQYQLLQKENQQLLKESKSTEAQLESVTTEKNRLLQQIDAMKINGSTMEESSKKDLEKRINIYLKEIDHCLALLNT